ncbi:MAG: helix-turn-helix transcriptional regulator [Candidatus Thiodiazotropha sp. 6PLUC5]
MNIKTIRKANLVEQIACFHSQREFSEQVGLTPAHVSQMVTGRRNMGDVVARRIEAGMDLPEGYMDVQHPVDGVEYQYPKLKGRTQTAVSDGDNLETLLMSVRQMNQRLSPKTRERAALNGKLKDEEWATLERLLNCFEKGS